MNNVIFLNLGPAITMDWKTDTGFVPQRVLPRQSCLRPSQTVTSARCQESAEFLILSLEPSFMSIACGPEAASEKHQLALGNGIEDRFIEGVCLALHQEAANRGRSGKLYSESLATSLALHLVRNYNAHGQPAVAPIASGQILPARMVRQAMEFIESNLGSNLSLRDIAGCVGLSQFHFARLFKQTIGISPYQFVLNRRIERARQLLIQGELTITAIAMEVGFSDQSHLTRQFKRHCGTTPKAFAEQYRSRKRPTA
jgi:AraC family transcriptional regulator